MAVNVGSGTPGLSATVGGFLKKGAANTAPGLDGTGFAALGAAATFTYDTGCTYAGSVVVRRIRIMHARMRAVIPVTFEMVNAGDMTETWATT